MEAKGKWHEKMEGKKRLNENYYRTNKSKNKYKLCKSLLVVVIFLYNAKNKRNIGK